MINSLPFFLWVKSGNISRKFLTFILKIFDKNFERLHLDDIKQVWSMKDIEKQLDDKSATDVAQFRNGVYE